jgi:O-antigen/teichoic acid export membrane protein
MATVTVPHQRKGAKLYLAASMVAPVVALVRNIAIARLLGVEMFGLAVTIILTAQFFDTITDAGIDKYIVQDADGNDPKVQGNAQLAMIVRGLISAGAMAACASPLAAFYGQPQLTGALVELALVPLLGGFLHLDIRRFQKAGNFRAEALMIIIAETLSLIAAVIAAWWLRDFRAAVYSLVVRSLMMVVVSHVMAERPYRVRFVAEQAKRLTRFGWPLLINATMLFFAGQGDRLLIGNQLGPAKLGLYSTTLLLIFYPCTVLHRYLSGIHFPAIVAARDTDGGITDAEETLKGDLLLAGVIGALGFVVVAPVVLIHVYGRDFASPALLVGLIGVLQVIRMLRGWPATVAFALGRTGNILIGNLTRLIAFPLGLAGIMLGYDLIGLTIGFIIGEFIALAITVIMLTLVLKRPLASLVGVGAIIAANSVLVACVGLILQDPRHQSYWWGALSSMIVLAFALVRDQSILIALRSGFAKARRLVRK